MIVSFYFYSLMQLSLMQNKTIYINLYLNIYFKLLHLILIYIK